MKILCALLTLAFATAGRADISVTGDGTVNMTPDMAIIFLAVVTDHSDVAAAIVTNGEASDRLYSRLADFKVERKDIVTTDFSIQGFTNDGKPGVTYYVTNQLHITVRTLSNLSAIMSAMTKSGANRFGGLTYAASNTAAATKQARALAMADAKSKADDLARLGGCRCGPVASITETSHLHDPQADRMSAAGGRSPLSGGQLSVTISVNVIYAGGSPFEGEDVPLPPPHAPARRT